MSVSPTQSTAQAKAALPRRRVNPWLHPHVLTVAWRDFAQLFFSPIAIVVTLVFVIQNGLQFWILLQLFTQDYPVTVEPFSMLFRNIAGLLLLFIIPPLTMKTFAEEKRLGTMETLMTAPITEAAVVLGKFVGVLGFYVFLWCTTIPYLVILKNYSAFDWGPVVTLYGGMLLLGGTFIAMGLLASSLTRDQIIALVVTVIAVSLWLTIPQVLTTHEKLAASPVIRQIGQYMSVNELIGETSLGLVSLKSVVFFVSATVLFLFLTTKVLESRKWAASGASALRENTLQRFTKFLGLVAVVLLLVDLSWAVLSTLSGPWAWPVFWNAAVYELAWLWITAAVLAALCVATNLRFFRSLVVAGRSRLLGNVVVQVATLGAALVLANLIGLRLDRRWDFTRWSVFSISEQTRSRLEAVELNTPLQITMIWSEDPQAEATGLRAYRMMERLIRSYSRLNPFISQQIVNPRLEPQRFERFKLQSGLDERDLKQQCLVVTYAGKNRVLELTDLFEMTRVNPAGGQMPQIESFRGESALTGAVLALTTSRPVVCFAVDGQSAVPRPGGFGQKGTLVPLRSLLDTENFAVREVNLALAGIPEDADLVVVFRPQAPLPPRAVENLRDYLAAPASAGASRGLLVVQEYGRGTSGLEELLTETGLELTDRLIVPTQATAQGLAWDQNGFVLALAPQEPEHPITAGSLADPVLAGRGVPAKMLSGLAIQVSPSSPGGMTALPVLANDPRTSAVVLSTQPLRFDTRGIPRVVMASSERTLPGATRRVVLLTDSQTFDSLLPDRVNTTLASNTLNWLTGRDRLIAGIAPRQLSRVRLDITERQKSVLSLITVVVMPSLVLSIGGLGWWIRRR